MLEIFVRPRAATLIAFAFLTVTLALCVSSVILQLQNSGLDTRGSAPYAIGFQSFALVGAFIAAKRPQNPIGWLFCLLALFNTLWAFAVQYTTHAFIVFPGLLPSGEWMAWFTMSWPGDIAWCLMIVFLPLLFPSGQLPSPRWRPVIGIATCATATLVASEMLRPGPVIAEGPLAIVKNPFGIESMSSWSLIVNDTARYLILILMLVAVASLIVRFRRSAGEERLQLKWFVYAVLLLPVLLGAALMADVADLPALDSIITFPLVVMMLPSILPSAVGVAVLKYRLYNIDPIINRTLVYGGLTACIVGIYVLIVAGLGSLLNAQNNLLLSLFATSFIAVLFQPLRERLQRGANRLMYGERDDPYAVLSKLNKQLASSLEPEAVLPTIVTTVTEALKLPYAAITLSKGEDSTVAAQAGAPVDNSLSLPLTYQHEMLGELLLAPRSSGEVFSKADLTLLYDLAHQAGIALHAMQLTEDLQRSRERLVTAREEERRRIRRDLHDGLGPALAAMNIQTGVLRRLISQDPAGAEAIATELRAEIRNAIGDVRRLVYDLRPPALDELGLIGAIRARAAELSLADKDQTLDISVEAPETLPPLPAAVEVAAYRIVQEALTNVVKHAWARRCQVGLEVADSLNLSIRDDGKGLPEARQAGIGLRSMRERAEELGGTFSLQARAEGGTQVMAQLPLKAR